MLKRILIALTVVIIAGIGLIWWLASGGQAKLDVADVQGRFPKIVDPIGARIIPVMNVPKAVGWKDGATPVAAPGLKVAAFATGLDHPRQVYVLPNGDVLVAESNKPADYGDGKGFTGWVQGLVMGHAGAKAPSANRITLLRDTNGDGVADVKTRFLTGLWGPYGMALVGDQLYVANTDSLWRFPYQTGATKIASKGVKVMDLPGKPFNHHWTKNLVASPDGKFLYIAIGSNSNVAENGMAAEAERARIWQFDLTTKERTTFAYGLRNPVGLAFEPHSKRLWTAVNERDELGSDIVPDYITSVQFGGFYGWPYYYWGGFPDKRVGPDESTSQEQIDAMAQYVTRPDYAVGPHTASLGLTFAEGAKLGPKFADGAFVGQHGSWNRRPVSGYKVIYVPFGANGFPVKDVKPVDVLTGFLNKDGEAQGRPVGVAVDKAGGLLVADDAGNTIWRVTGK
ncbi:PQQ-dependent sugar dehydrogenase [Sphingomonas sp. ID0503]|uniref:PQQ-dependent sugar dehydrogenase n=1 Tax=Sphingomonas sp. ID0503 TaxID=3399691 RepID=UPI003AFAC965